MSNVMQEAISAKNRLGVRELDSLVHDRASLRYEPVDVRRMVFRDGRLLANDTEWHIDDQSLSRLCSFLNAPTTYLCGRSQGAREFLINEHLAEFEFDSGIVMVGNDATQTFKGLVRSDLTVLAPAEILQAIRDGVGSQSSILQATRLEVADDRFVLDLVSPDCAEEVRPRDIVQAGLRVESFPLDNRATTVEAFFVRLICSNGMTQRECIQSGSIRRTRRLPVCEVNAKQRQIDQLRCLIAEVWTGLENRLAGLRPMASEPVEVRPLLEQFLRHGRLYSNRLLKTVLESWEIEGAESTAFGVMNGLTHAGTHNLSLSDRQRNGLMALGGILAHRKVHICRHCFSVVSA